MNETLIINLVMAIVIPAVKNKAKKAALKKLMLKLRDAINSAYSTDPDFE